MGPQQYPSQPLSLQQPKACKACSAQEGTSAAVTFKFKASSAGIESFSVPTDLFLSCGCTQCTHAQLVAVV